MFRRTKIAIRLCADPAVQPGVTGTGSWSTSGTALPYELHVEGEVAASQGGVRLVFRNTGKAGAAFHVRSGNGQTGRWTYTAGAGDETSDNFGSGGATSYDFAVSGPNGFLRTFTGGLAAGSANP